MSDVCPIKNCGYGSNMRQFDEEVARPLNLQTTRSNKSEGAHRDMYGFSVDEELARLRRAVQETKCASPESLPDLYKFITEAFVNIDEHLLREGDIPRTWWSAATSTEALSEALSA